MYYYYYYYVQLFIPIQCLSFFLYLYCSVIPCLHSRVPLPLLKGIRAGSHVPFSEVALPKLYRIRVAPQTKEKSACSWTRFHCHCCFQVRWCDPTSAFLCGVWRLVCLLLFVLSSSLSLPRRRRQSERGRF
jgi:hypothetical protein